MSNKCECYGCESRYVGCHGECVSYIAFSKGRNEMLDKRHEYITERANVDNQKIDSTIKLLKRDKKRKLK